MQFSDTAEFDLTWFALHLVATNWTKIIQNGFQIRNQRLQIPHKRSGPERGHFRSSEVIDLGWPLTSPGDLWPRQHERLFIIYLWPKFGSNWIYRFDWRPFFQNFNQNVTYIPTYIRTDVHTQGNYDFLVSFLNKFRRDKKWDCLSRNTRMSC